MAKYALLIGIGDYHDIEHFSPIPCCRKDVKNIHRVVKNPELMNYNDNAQNVIMFYDRAREDFFWPIEARILDQLQKFAKKATPQDTLFLYFSGHGCTKDGQAYLVAKDSYWNTLGNYSRGIKISTIKKILWDSKAGQKIAIIDACHSGEKLSKAEEPLVDDRFHDALGDLSEGIAVLSSCKKGERSWTIKNQSIFTKYVLQGLKGKAKNENNEVTFFSLSKYVGDKVTSWASKEIPPKEQTPTLHAKIDARGITLVPFIKPTHKVAKRRMREKKRSGFIFALSPCPVTDTEGKITNTVHRPLVSIRISDPKMSKTLRLIALVDTGSDKNLIPSWALKILGCKAQDGKIVHLSGFGGEVKAEEYDIRIEFQNMAFLSSVYGIENTQWAILGSPFLQKVKVMFDYNKRMMTFEK